MTCLSLHLHLGAWWVSAKASEVQHHQVDDYDHISRRSWHLLLSVPSLERSAVRGLPYVGSAELTWTVLSLDLDIPFPLEGVHPVVQAVEVVGDLDERDEVD